jgi:hypothetical protein
MPYHMYASSSASATSCFICPSRSRKTGPTDDRGWCYQESLIAKRMIIYGEEQLSFRCRARQDFEDGMWWSFEEMDDWYKSSFLLQDRPTQNDIQTRQPRGIKLAGYELEAQIPGIFSPFLLVDSILRSWYLMVMGYSSRSFFDPTDNHAALSGIVYQYQAALARRFGDNKKRYMAGLWEMDLLMGLYWKSLHMKDPSLRALEVPVRNGVTVQRAPSWSWMALGGPIYYTEMSSQPIEALRIDDELCCVPANADGKLE